VTSQQLIDSLGNLGDTQELVLAGRAGPDSGEPLLDAWRIAAGGARAAYARWCTDTSALAHAAYLAAEDQADAATVTLCAAQGGGCGCGAHAQLPLAA
jgi:hypothetical protein